MTTVKQIHDAFKKESCKHITASQLLALEKTGFELSAPMEYAKLFPFNKIIHLNRIVLLCEKYDLVFTETKNYSGVIPKKNLVELQEFTDQYDYAHYYKYPKYTLWDAIRDKTKETEYSSFIRRDKCKDFDEITSIYQWFIVAPKNMVVTDTQRTARVKVAKEQKIDELTSSLLQVLTKDPIIIGMIKPEFSHQLLPSNTKIKWGVIITAWGDEASDESVVNENMN